MPLRFYRRLGAGPFRLNVSKGGISYSFGGRHAWITLGRGRVRTSVGLPGTGLYWYSQRRVPKPQPKSGLSVSPPDQSLLWTPGIPAPNGLQWLVLVGIIAVIVVLAWMVLNN